MPLNERNDPEMSYRRGFQADAFEMLCTVERFLDPETRKAIRAWIQQDSAADIKKPYRPQRALFGHRDPVSRVLRTKNFEIGPASSQRSSAPASRAQRGKHPWPRPT